MKIVLRALVDRRQRDRVGALVGVLGHPEDAELRVHAVEPAVLLVDPQPGDVVAVERDVVAVAQHVGRQHHREVGLARRAREAAADVVVLAGLLVVDPDQHVLLGEELLRRPAVVRRLAQAVGDLAEQRVAAVGRAEVQDRPLVGDGHEVARVVGRPLAEVLQVAGHVHGLHELVGVVEVLDVLHADPRHPDHVQHHGAGVGELDAGGPGRELVAGRRHQVWDDVHRLAARGTAHALLEQRPHLRGGPPVVVDTPVALAVGGHDRPLLGAGGVLVVAPGVVAPLPCWQQLTGVQRLLDQTRVVLGVDDLYALGPRQVRPVAHVLAHLRVRQPRFVQCRCHIHHRRVVLSHVTRLRAG